MGVERDICILCGEMTNDVEAGFYDLCFEESDDSIGSGMICPDCEPILDKWRKDENGSVYYIPHTEKVYIYEIQIKCVEYSVTPPTPPDSPRD